MAAFRGNPPEDELAPAVLLGVMPLAQLWCARDGVTDDELVAIANAEPPMGTDSPTRWRIDDHHQSNGRCPDFPNRRHQAVSC
jgi:hypothetical protein